MAEHRNDEYRIPVRRQSAVITLATGARLVDAVLFCEVGLEIEALLEGDQAFLPVGHDSRVRLIARRVVAVVTTAPRVDTDEERLMTRRLSVAVGLCSGEILEGDLVFEPRPGGSRVLDVLNGAARTLQLRSSEAVHHVAKEHVEYVEER
ncbi:MAG: hypothetical protein M3O50_11535 [Myxococcota bacterium]|nr:hypothetical protein [Myxococcota bacterium]